MGNRTQRRRINPIDLIVILLVVALGIFGGYKFLRSRAGGGGGSTQTKVVYKVKVEAQDLRTYESLKKKVPSQIMAGESLYPGYVTEVSSEPCTFYTLDKDGLLIQTEDEKLVNIVFTVEYTVSNGSVQTNKVGTQEVRIGKAHILKTEYFELNGYIIEMDWPAA